jgi:2-haloacid dehalogenase/putative hydrolase of the HAD superfamily
MRYKAVLLDFYGTLVVEDDAILARITQEIADHSPLHTSSEQISRRWYELMSAMCRVAYGTHFRLQREIELCSLQQLLREFAVDLDSVSLSASIFGYWQVPCAYPETGEFLSRLQIPVCIVSNIDDADLRSAIHTHGWHLPMIVTSEMCRAYKPRAEMFEMALSQLGLHPSGVLHVGDSIGGDVAGAQSVGIDVAWINRRNRSVPLPAPTYIAANLTDLVQLVVEGI